MGSRSSRSKLTPIGALILGAAVFCLSGFADSITVNGRTYDNVVVRASATRYLVEIPADGTVMVIPKKDVDSDAVVIESGEARDALHQVWESNSPFAEKELIAEGDQVAPGEEADDKREPILITNRNADRSADSPLGGDQSDPINRFLPGYGSVYAGSNAPPVLGSGPNVPRFHPGTGGLSAVRAPRTADIIIHEQGGRSAAVAGNAGGFRGGGGGVAGGGFGAGVGGNAAVGGQAGGFGGGAAGFGGGAGGGGPVFSNISDLFFTIDDRLVGETPAVIGMQVSVSR